MKEFLTVLGFTFKENIKKKAFIISTVIMLIITIVLLSIPGIMNHFGNKGGDGNSTQQAQQGNKGIVYVLDPEGFIKNDLGKLSQTFTGYEFKNESAANLESLKERAKNDNNTSLIVINNNAGVPSFDYYVKQFGSGLNPDAISKYLKVLNATRQLKAANVPDNVAALALSEVQYNVKELGKGMMKSYISSILISMLLFFAIYFYGYGVSMSIASEKTSRVMEILVTSTKPSKIVLGKSVAMGLLGLCQLSLIVLSGIITYKLSFPENFAIGGQRIDFSNFTPSSLLMIILYFILGYSLYSMMNAVAGATVSKAEDVNSAIMPISMVLMISFYFAYFTLLSPSGRIAAAASMIPFSAPFSMPCRVLAADVPVWQILISVFGLLLTIVLVAWISIKMYSSAVLHYGSRLRLKDLMRMSK